MSYTVNEAFVFSEQVKVTYRFDRKEPIDIQFVVKDADTFALHGDAAVDFIETAASAEKVALRVYAENRVFTSVFPLSSFANDSRPLMGKCKWPNR